MFAVKQLEQKPTDKIARSQTDTQSIENTTTQLERKLADKIADSQMNIQTLENTVKQLEQKLLNKDNASQTYTQPDRNTIAQLKHTPASHKNTSQNILKIDKPENTENSLGLLLFSVNFNSGEFIINDNTKKLIQQSTQYILSLPPNYRVIVKGHTDNSPIKTTSEKIYLYKDNKNLSLYRAKTIAGIFEKEGISSKRISAIGYGETHPIASNKTAEGRAKNRRVVIRLIPEEKEI
jgi:flagellar motor protein MotB